MQIKKNTEGKMLLMGGIEQEAIDRADATEELIRSEARKAIDT